LITVWVLIFVCSGHCDRVNANGQILTYFPSLADCAAAGGKPREGNDGFAVNPPKDGDSKGVFHFEPINPYLMTPFCYELRLDDGGTHWANVP
jgi:hypothetical protein